MRVCNHTAGIDDTVCERRPSPLNTGSCRRAISQLGRALFSTDKLFCCTVEIPAAAATDVTLDCITRWDSIAALSVRLRRTNLVAASAAAVHTPSCQLVASSPRDRWKKMHVCFCQLLVAIFLAVVTSISDVVILADDVTVTTTMSSTTTRRMPNVRGQNKPKIIRLAVGPQDVVLRPDNKVTVSCKVKVRVKPSSRVMLDADSLRLSFTVNSLFDFRIISRLN